jgi:N-acetylneuraminate synthase/N,N'-diacetyllegionaminate synthase
MQPAQIKIDQRIISATNPTFIIAEIGVNHDGSTERALELVDIAAHCGVDAVKLQIFTATNLMHAQSQFAGYQKKQVTDADPSAMLRRYELSPPDLRRVVQAIRRRGMLPIATPFSLADVDVVAALDLPAIKIASPDLVNRPLLQKAATLARPLIVSTGAATMDEIATSVGWMRQTPLALLHCISSYPTPTDQANLCWISELSNQFALPVGYSDHTTEIISGSLAVAAGASIIEKHLTFDRSAPGPDHAASADPDQFAQYVQLIRTAESLRGVPGKRVLEIEQDVRRVSRQSLVAARDLQRGQTLRQDDFLVQRPGTGISAADVSSAVGRRTIRPIPRGTLLQWDMLADAA